MSKFPLETLGHFVYLLLRPKSQTLVETKFWYLINMQIVLNHVSDQLSHLTGKRRNSTCRPLYHPNEATTSFVTYLFCLHLGKLKWFGLIQTKVRFMFCLSIGSQTKLLVSNWRLRLVSAWDTVTHWLNGACLCMQNDLPDGAVLVEVDEDDLASDTAPSIPAAESDVQMPLTNNGSHKSAVFERKKEKGRPAHTHIHPFNSPFSGTTQVSRYQKGKTNLDFTEVRDSDWQWHQPGHMQVGTLLQTDNHTSTPPLCFLQAGCPSCRPTNSVKARKAK